MSLATKIRLGRGTVPFAPVPLALLDTPNISAGDIAAYVALRSYADFGRDTGARPSHESLARRAGLSEKGLRLALVRLHNMGWVDWVSGRTDGKPNEYVVHSVPLRGGTVSQGDLEGGSVPGTEGVGTTYRGGRYQVPTTESPYQEPIPVPSPAASGGRHTWLTPYFDWAKRTLKGTPSTGAMAKHLRALDTTHGSAAVLRWLDHYFASLSSPQYFSWAKFAETAGSWETARSRDWRDPMPGESTDAYIARMNAGPSRRGKP